MRRLGPNALNEGYTGNSIRTSKYNILTFLPFFFFYMFRRVAYLYFLTQVCGTLPCPPYSSDKKRSPFSHLRVRQEKLRAWSKPGRTTSQGQRATQDVSMQFGFR